MINKREEYERLKMNQLQKSNPIRYNFEMCKIIERNIARIELPRLTKEEMRQLKEHLEDHTKIKMDGLAYKFFNLRNSFFLINEFETRAELRRQLVPIMKYLAEFKYIFDLIIESQMKRENPILEKALLILDVPVNKFCMLYAYVLVDIEHGDYDFEDIQLPKENAENTVYEIDDKAEEKKEPDDDPVEYIDEEADPTEYVDDEQREDEYR